LGIDSVNALSARPKMDYIPAMLARLLAVVMLASPLAHATCEAPEHHRLDFWLGHWEVRNGGVAVAESRIERSPEGCAIIEHYRERRGYTGTSINFSDPFLNRWRQSWVDSRGGVGEFTGEPGEGSMAFTGETHRADGKRILRRMTLTRLPDGSVRQHSLGSTDGGRTWKPDYDFVYVPIAAARESPELSPQ
jgi:hypothetical protein